MAGDGGQVGVRAGADGGHRDKEKSLRAIIVGFSACRWPGGHVACLNAGRTLWATQDRVSALCTTRRINHGRHSTLPRRRQGPSVLQHRRRRQARAPRWPLHRAPGFLQPDRQGQRGKRPHRAGPPDVLARRRRPSVAHRGAPAQASRRQGARPRPSRQGDAARPRAAELPADAIEVGRIADAWGIKGWFKVLPHSASPEALFSSKRWFLQPSETGAKPAFTGTVLLRIREAKEHSDSIVATGRRGRRTAMRPRRCAAPASSSRDRASPPRATTSTTGST
jgi:hypothetical protein